MAPYILFGLLFAGILHELISESIVTKHLGKDNISSAIDPTSLIHIDEDGGIGD